MKRTVPMSAIVSLGLIMISRATLAQEVEPGVQTSSSAAPVQQPAAPAAGKTAPAPKPKSAVAGTNPVEPKVASTPPAGPASPASPRSNAADRIELGTTQISGNRELPKVMYVVPWRRADPGDFAGRPPNSLLDEALTPVDRDVFRRQNSYYGAVRNTTPASAPQSGAAAASQSTATPKDEK